MPVILDGAAIASAIKQEVAEEVTLLAARGIRPGLAAVLVGHVAASEIYVRSKVQACADLGIYSDLITPPDTVTTEQMLDLVTALNSRDDIDGILVQLPLPKQVDTKVLLDAIDPAKDVDGFHPVNAGRFQAGRPALAPCTPAGVIEILKRSGIPISGQHAVVVGRSDIVGKPAAMLLLHRTQRSPSATRRPETWAKLPVRPTFWSPPSAGPASSPRRWSSPARPSSMSASTASTPRGIRPLLCRQRKARSRFCQARLGARGRHPSQSIRAVGRLYAGSRRGGTADHRHADGQHRARGQNAAGDLTMLRVGLTGGLGSGKSTVAGFLRELGAQVIEADALGREMMEPGQLVYTRIVEHFGPEVVPPMAASTVPGWPNWPSRAAA